MGENRMNNNQLGDFLRSQRLNREKSQKGAADEAGVPQSVLSRIESGAVKNPRMETLHKLARVLGVTFETLASKESPEITAAPFNARPFIEALARSASVMISVEDLEFLITTQRGLSQTMTPGLIDALMTARQKKEEI